MKILEALNEFRFSCSSCKLEGFGGELINDTFYLKNSDVSKPDGLLQRINPRIFKDIKLLMKNISLAIDYFEPDGEQVIDPVRPATTKEGGSQYYRDTDGYYWRMYHLLSRRELCKIKDIHENAFNWASVFGKFISDIDELPIQSLVEIEPTDLLHASATKRAPEEIKNEIDYVLRLIKQLTIMNNIWREEQWLNSTIERAARLDRKRLRVLNEVNNYSGIELEMNRNRVLAY
ncbi:hypothetical protein SAMN04488029_1688 [Reichenbachiella faecimaris]|uniref:Uncharacterized protein n=1 Tax=Reichenbachiella faecimaris TaxID=692418 RepID=A0A1W2GBG7_REIFA|nr:hypothetical protein [Reichenbachiella faecimaris]SMD33822.1 hypothetical protein SAMN04488029_1688 [Reichenbachiella faecimaris]